MEPNYRRCVSCRRLAHKQSLWRIVRLYPSAEVCLDHGSGRSAYLCSTTDCLQLAQKKNRLGRSLKVAIPETIYTLLWHRLSPDIPATSPAVQYPGDPDRGTLKIISMDAASFSKMVDNGDSGNSGQS